MSEAGLKPPRFKFGSFFTIIFQRPTVKTLKKEGISQVTTQKTTQRILELIIENPNISRKELSIKLGDITEDGVKYHLRRLIESEMLKRIGPDKGGHWEIVVG